MNEERQFWAVRHRNLVNHVQKLQGVHVERIEEGKVDDPFRRPIIGVYPTRESAEAYPNEMPNPTAWAKVTVFDFGGDAYRSYIGELKGPFRAIEGRYDDYSDEYFITGVFGSKERAEEFDSTGWNLKRLHL